MSTWGNSMKRLIMSLAASVLLSLSVLSVACQGSLLPTDVLLESCHLTRTENALLLYLRMDKMRLKNPQVHVPSQHFNEAKKEALRSVPVNRLEGRSAHHLHWREWWRIWHICKVAHGRRWPRARWGASLICNVVRTCRKLGKLSTGNMLRGATFAQK